MAPRLLATVPARERRGGGDAIVAARPRSGRGVRLRRRFRPRDAERRLRSMCGIVGYVGPRDAVPVIVEGLRRLEYRGYDSAGIAVVADGVLERRRSVGKLQNLEENLAKAPLRARSASATPA